MTQPAAKPWSEWLMDLLAGLLTRQDLAAAGAGSEALAGAVTARVDLPSGYTAPAPPPGLEQSRDLADAAPELVRRYLLLKTAFQERAGRCLIETCTYRSQAEQQRLYAIGRRGVPGEKTVTQLDGVTKRSRHMRYPSEAVDVAVDVDPGPGKHIVWDHASYEPLGPLAAEFGLVWGGNWHIDDYPHLELPA